MPPTISPLRRAATLRTAPSRDGGAVHRGAPGEVIPDGGAFRAGLIRGASVITVGEALGHGFHIDADFLTSLAAHMEGLTPETGIKSRFRHPGLSSDGMGSVLGRASHPRLRLDDLGIPHQLLADIHLLPSAHETPEGDLAGYTMALATESPDLFGTSIVFSHDREAEDAFLEAHTHPIEDRDGNVIDRRFRSPDQYNNPKNLPHARLARFHAVDVVDSPAANPGGMFSALSDEGRMVETFQAALAYATGLTDVLPPESDLLPIHPTRLRRFTADWMADRGLTLVSSSSGTSAGGAAVTTPPQKDTPTPTPPTMFNKNADAAERIAHLETENSDLAEKLAATQALAESLQKDLDESNAAALAADQRAETLSTDLAGARAELDVLSEQLAGFDDRVTAAAAAAVHEELAKMGHDAPLAGQNGDDLPGSTPSDPAAQLEAIQDSTEAFQHARAHRAAILKREYAR